LVGGTTKYRNKLYVYNDVYASHLSAVAGTVTTLETDTLTINTGVTIPANQISLGSATHGSIAGSTGHLDGVFYTVAFSAGGAGETLTHGLGRAAVGWKQVRTDSTHIVYCSHFLATATNVQFTATSAGNSKLFIF